MAQRRGWNDGLVTWKKKKKKANLCLQTRWQSLALLVHNWCRHTPKAQMHTSYPNTLSSTAALLCLSTLSSFTFCRKRRLSYEVFSDKRPERHPNTAREMQKDKERGGDRTGGQEQNKAEPECIYPFSYSYLKQIFTVTAVQATGSEISPSAQAPEDLIQTFLYVHQLLWQALLSHDRMS